VTKLSFHHVQSKQSTCDSDRKLLRDGSEGCPILLKKEISVQTCRLGTFYSKLARLVDFCGLRTKVCRTFSIVSSSTQGRLWPGCVWDTQTDLTNRLYYAKIAFLFFGGGVILCDTWSWIFSEWKWATAVRDTTNNSAARSTSLYESMMTSWISLTVLYEWNAIWQFEWQLEG
jgi:hypothetical protein